MAVYQESLFTASITFRKNSNKHTISASDGLGHKNIGLGLIVKSFLPISEDLIETVRMSIWRGVIPASHQFVHAVFRCVQN